MKEWLTAAEIAATGAFKAGTPQGINKIAEREGWQRRAAAGSSRAWEYHITVLPKPAAARYLARSAPKPVARIEATAQPANLPEYCRRRLDARLLILQEIDRHAEFKGLNQAVKHLVELAASGALSSHLQALVPVANARAGKNGSRTLSRRSLLRWRAKRQKGIAALAPRDGRSAPAPAWAKALLDVCAQPQKPSLPVALEMIAAVLPAGVPVPSYHQARRFLEKMSVIDRNRGRMGPRALKSLRSFVRRDLSELLPLDLGLMDGHGWDSEVAHPVHGQAFKPEITTIIDAVTRKAIGWSAGLAESAQAVMDALRHAATSHGVLAILYVDRGSGYHADIISSPTLGLLARLGTRHEESLPYNSQARGLIERLHQSIWIRAAKKQPTYIGADMDPEAAKKVHKLTRTALGRSLLMPWRDFLDFAQREIDAYNARPHRSLPKVTDEATGKRRHMSPNEAWAAHVESGWTPTLLSEAESADLFRPMREATTRRGEVVLFGNVYFNRDLEHRHGERVNIAYDIHDPSRVTVKDLQGRTLCEAELDGNKRSFFPMSVVEQARHQRAAGRARRLQVQLDEIAAEVGALTIDGTAEPLDAETEALAAEQLRRLMPPPANDPAPGEIAPGARPVFTTDEDFATWCLANRASATPGDLAYLAELLRSPSFCRLIGYDAAGAEAAS